MWCWSWWLKESNFEGSKLTGHPLDGATQMAMVPVSASAAVMADASRADNALAQYLIQYVRIAVLREMEELQSPRSDLAPFTVATFSSLLQLELIPHLRMQSRFPALMAWARSMTEQACQLNGATCLQEPLSSTPCLTTDERSWAAECRSTIVEELQDMSTYLEAKIEQLAPGLRTVVERYLNSTSEMMWVMWNTVQDPAFREVAERTAETCVRCRFRRPPRSAVTPRAVPTSYGYHHPPARIATSDVVDPRDVGPMPLDTNPGLRGGLPLDASDSEGDGIIDG